MNYSSFTINKEELDSFEIPEPTAEGEIFLGWDAQYDMELGKIVSHGNKLTEADFADSNIITLVASYKYPASADEDRIITLNANGGLIDGREVNYYHPALHVSGSGEYDLNLLVPERQGYKFTGWNTKADGTGDTVLNTDYAAVSVKGIMLYAQWKKMVLSEMSTVTEVPI